MNLFAIANVVRGRDTAPARLGMPRSTASVRTTPERSFQGDLDAARSVYTVRSGDTLSEIVHRHLRQTGREVTRAELYARVDEVARANGLANADLIFVGQQLDLGPEPAAAPTPPEHPVREAHVRPAAPETRGVQRVVADDARISSLFGPRRDPIDGSVREHRGIDIAARRGAAIRAAAAGMVVFAGWRGGYGNTVIVRHADGSETLYAHADRLTVQEGDRVRESDRLGLVGSTGRSTAPHLHFEVREDGVAVDPLGLLQGTVGD